MVVGIRTVLLLGFAAASSMGCLTKHETVVMRTGQGEAMPVIAIQPGYQERIALMDRYRLHDEDRKHMMRRPHVWVEEVPEDEVPANPEESPPEEVSSH